MAPHCKHVRSQDDIHIEPLNLLPAHPSNIRPANVGIQLNPAANKHGLKYIAIDVTIPPPPVPHPASSTDLSDLQNLADYASRTHQLAARGKLIKDPIAASLMNQDKMILVPSTVDHLGGLGSFATQLLFGKPAYPGPHTPPQWDDHFFGMCSSRASPKPEAFELFQAFQHCPTNLTAVPSDFEPLSSKTLDPHSQPTAFLPISTFSKIALGHAILTALATHIHQQQALHDAHSMQKRQHRYRSSLYASLFRARPKSRPSQPRYSSVCHTKLWPRPLAWQ